MTDRLKAQGGAKRISVTDFVQTSVSNDGEKLLFSKPYAWCIQKALQPITPYPDYATVDLLGDYLVYGLKVDGLRDNINVPSDRNIAESFKIQYGIADDNGRQVFAWYNAAVVSISNCAVN